jgi:SEC-C motif domain protein
MNELDLCPCGSGRCLSDCCKPFIDGTATAPTAEALMRSRYTAYTLQNVDYLEQTLDAHEREDYDGDATAAWARDSRWLGLEIVDTTAGTADDKEGTVEFKARYENDGATHEHHEVSHFSKINGAWYYSGGKEVGPAQYRRETPKVGRNDPCPCGSGKKYKKCCGK